ncbi:glycerol-3-phosphate 1-O-acyltransferase PlsY [soil metagenome]
MSELQVVAVPVTAYLVGAVPFALLIGFMAGVDLRRTGTGNIGAGNLTRSVGLRHGAAAALLDGLKGLVPILVARRLGLSPSVVAMTGVAAVAGHNWPIYLRGRGGRGLATSAGAVCGMAPVLLLWAGAWAMTGWRIGGGVAGFVGWGLLPALAISLGQPRDVVIATTGLALMMMARRMQGNADSAPGPRAALERTVWDMDRESRRVHEPAPT